MTQSNHITLLEVCNGMPEFAAAVIIFLCRELGRDPSFTKQQLDDLETENWDKFTVYIENENAPITINIME
jgi:hypothetical protein